MKLFNKFTWLIFLSLLSVATCEEPSIEIYFSPHGGCTAAIIKEINSAKSSVEVQAYELSSTTISAALVNAAKRSVSVYVILDMKNSTAFFSKGDYLQKQGIPVRADGKHAIMHDKIIIIDDSTVITGSFNFTDSAENSNAENLIIVHDQATAKKYLDNWKTHLQHSSILPTPRQKPGRL